MLLSTSSAQVKTETSTPRVVVLTLDRVALAHWPSAELPNLSKLMDRSTHGLVSLRTLGKITPDKVFMMIGAGGTAPAGNAVGWAYDVNEILGPLTAGEAYTNLHQRSHLKGPVHLGISKLRREMEEDGAFIGGQLGQGIHDAGLRTAVFGNYDAFERLNRSGVTMVMDSNGLTDFGVVGRDILTTDLSFPFGLRTDYQRMIGLFKSVRQNADLTLLVTGDMERLELFRSRMSEAAFVHAHEATLKQWDSFLEKLLYELDDNTLLVILIPSPPETLIKSGERMTPVLLHGPGFVKGLIYSHSTRLVGVMTPADLSATILKFLQLDVPPGINGRPIKVVNGDILTLKRDHKAWMENYRQRWPILSAYVYLMIVLLLAGIIGIFFLRRQRFRRCIRRGLISLIGVPLSFLIVSLFNPSSVLVTTMLTMLVAILLAIVVSVFFRDDRFRIMALSLTTAGVILVDLLSGASLLKSSILSYSVMLGARYYGLGNEYMGILLGSFLMGISGFYDILKGKARRYLNLAVALAMVFTGIVIIHPYGGANVGGGISAFIGFSVAMLIFSGRRIRLWQLATIVLLVSFILVGMAINDYRLDQGNTHLGQSIRLIESQGLSVLKQIIERKWKMNMGLMLVTPWSKVLILFILTLPLLLRRPPGTIQRLLERYPSFIQGVAASGGTALIALTVNDSGIVAAATTMIFGGIGLFCLVLREVSIPLSESTDNNTVGGMGIGD